NSGYQDLEVNTAASYGVVVGVSSYVSAGADNFVIKLMSGATSTGYITITKAGGESLDAIIVSINQHYASTGIWASTGAAGTSLAISRIGAYGSTLGLEVSAAAATILGATSGIDYGINVVASIAGTALQGNGLVAYGSGGAWSSFSVTLTSALGGTAAVISSAVTISPNGAELKFALTDDASATNLVSYGINNMQAAKIGNDATLANTGGLNDIIAGATYNLTTNAAAAISIIDKAISDVSNERASMGSFQKYTLETTINNLGVTKENLTASESRIRDVDMAAEMMNFTKNQILVQAGTAMLAQANQLPQSVLQLLK
ncbi:MAG: flagellin, partial [Candidatus Margulisiibacteriota bacterium]